MDHMRIHHQDEYNAVVVANSKGVALAAFTAQRKEPRVRALLGNASVRESADNSPATPNATPNAGNGTGAALHEASMARRSAVEALFQDTAAQQPGAPGTQSSMPDMFKASSSWTDKQDKQWKEELVWMCGVFWRSVARTSCGMIKRSAIGLSMFLSRHHSLTALTSLKTL